MRSQVLTPTERSKIIAEILAKDPRRHSFKYAGLSLEVIGEHFINSLR
jgi:hypothetical protein